MENQADNKPVSETPAEGAETAPAGADRAEALQKELSEAQAKAAEYLDGWQRARAELANYKRRREKEQAEAYQNATSRGVKRYLDVLDDFDRAMQERPAPADGDLAQWVEGTALIHRKFQNVLDAEGVTRIEAEGHEFDPNFHEAVTHEECDGHASGQIIAVVRQGYKLGDRVIRPALVRVAK
jgi:molecular chaperone GrpE